MQNLTGKKKENIMKKQYYYSLLIENKKISFRILLKKTIKNLKKPFDSCSRLYYNVIVK